jgi:cytochrome P450
MHTNSLTKLAPGPRALPVLGNTWGILRQGQVAFQVNNWRRYGDLFRYQVGPYLAHTIVRPDDVYHVLAQRRENYEKGPGYAKTRELLGYGLLTSEGELWQQQRRRIQPPFTHRNVLPFAQVMVGATDQMLERWERAAQQGTAIDIHDEMTRLTLNIIGRTMFSFAVGESGSAMVAAYSTASTYVNLRLAAFFDLPLAVPTPANRRFKRAVRTLDQLVYQIIAERRRQPNPPDDLLTRLIYAQDEQSDSGMGDHQLRDEIMTIFFAGHETTAEALTWAWWLLAQHPEALARLENELEHVLAGQPPTAADLPRLVYTQMVWQETLRLYPPVWIFPRAAREEDEIGGYRIPAGSLIFPCQFLTHRHPEFWTDPERFDPERFAPGQEEGQASYAYYPFGGGPRRCIGTHFAALEGPLILAAVAQRFRMRLASAAPVGPKSAITLHPDRPIPMQLERQQFTA